MIYRFLQVLLFIGLCAIPSGCAGTLSLYDATQPEESTEPEGQWNARAQASLQLTDQGRTLLESGRPDDAISMLERSVGLDPTNGQSYYFLSEAWLLKNNPTQAAEFNRLAELYLSADPAWSGKVLEQKEQIDRFNNP